MRIEDDEKLKAWTEELGNAFEANDPARVLELRGWIEARRHKLEDELND